MVSTTHPTTDTARTAPERATHHPSRVAAFAAWLRRDGWVVISLMLLGLALRVWFLTVNELQPYFSPADDGDYYQRALRFATTGQYLDDFWLIRPPLHVWLFAGMIRLSIMLGDVPGVLLIRIAQTSMVLLTIPAGYDLARRLFGNRAGLLFAAILAVWYPLVELPAHMFSEPSFFVFLIFHLWLLLVWRDTRRWWWLVAAAVMLGLSSLARSPTLYSGAFVLLYLLLEMTASDRVPPDQRLVIFRPATWRAAFRPAVLLTLVGFTLACATVVLPWTYRNYATYGRPILIDTIGPVNLWLHIEKYPERGVDILKTMPQGERQDFAVSDTARIFQRDPAAFAPLLLRNAPMHFQHVWKAQFVEDYFIKRSFYGRPLRAIAPLGLFGDVLWLVFTVGGAVALCLPRGTREGHFRVLAFLWVSYTIFAMMIMHIEPRYLLPVWLFFALYATRLFADPAAAWRQWRQHRWLGVLALGVGITVLALILSYRNYPQIISEGLRREQHNAAGMHALAVGDATTAVRELTAASAIHPTFTETRANLALAHLSNNDDAAAWEAMGDTDAQRMNLVRGLLELRADDPATASAFYTDAETRSGEDVQQFALDWLPVAPTHTVELGTGLDLGYIAGFSPGEQQGDATYRWLQGNGAVRLPLNVPLAADSVVWLRLATGRPTPVPLTVTYPDGTQLTVPVRPDGWRSYRLPVPPALHGSDELRFTLDAPVFIPAHVYPESIDARDLSLMVGAVGVN